MRKPIISADSHVTEPPGTYVDRIDKRFRDRAPRLVHDAKRGDLFVIDGLDKPRVVRIHPRTHLVSAPMQRRSP